MRQFESAHVLRTNTARSGWSEINSGRPPAQNTELPRLLGGVAVVCVGQEIGQKVSVDSVNTFGFGPGRTSAGLARTRNVFWSSQRLQGLECSSSPTLGTQTPSSEGVIALSVCTKLWPVDSDGWFAGFGLAAAVAYSGVWVADSVPWLVGLPPAVYGCG